MGPHKLMEGNDAVVCVTSMMINENGNPIDVGGGNHFGGGEADAEPLDDGDVLVNNIISTGGLVEVEFKKKALVEWAKPYLASVKTRLEKERPERVQPFMVGAQAFVQMLIKEHDEYYLCQLGHGLRGSSGVCPVRGRSHGAEVLLFPRRSGIILPW